MTGKIIHFLSLSLSITTINGTQCATDFEFDLISLEEVAIRKQ